MVRYTYKGIILFIFACNSLFGQWNITGGLSGEVSFSNRGASYFSVAAVLGIERELFLNSSDKSIEYQIGRHLRPAYQVALGVYSNGLGDNILDQYKDFNIDFQHSFLLTLGFEDMSDKIKSNTITHSPTNNTLKGVVADPFMWSLTLGSTFIINNNSRNQRIGFGNLNLGRVLKIGYYNDGPPFNKWWLPFGDARDRWWTGGGFGELFFTQGLTSESLYLVNSRFGYYYDRFTGDVQAAYEVSNVLGFNYVPSINRVDNFYNVARGKFAFHFYEDNFDISWQALGHLKRDIQDGIHNLGNWAHHLTFAQRYWNMIGLQYHQTISIK